jgi:hypothetical protein
MMGNVVLQEVDQADMLLPLKQIQLGFKVAVIEEESLGSLLELRLYQQSTKISLVLITKQRFRLRIDCFIV